jgi:hypothetical protein
VVVHIVNLQVAGLVWVRLAEQAPPQVANVPSGCAQDGRVPVSVSIAEPTAVGLLQWASAPGDPFGAAKRPDVERTLSGQACRPPRNASLRESGGTFRLLGQVVLTAERQQA